MRGKFDNTWKLSRFILRRERVTSLVWIVAIVLFSAALAPAMTSMFDDAGRMQFAESFNNPVMIAMMGPVYGIDNYTAGAMYGGMMLLWVMIAVAIMNIFLVVRHTRADEEHGRAEVVRSLPTGRLAGLSAAMTTALIVNIVLSLLTGLALAATGIPSMDIGSCLMYAAVIGAVGLVFAAIAALFSQLSSNASGATGMSILVMGVFYLLRAAGDINGNEAVACISPLGLGQRSQAFVSNNILPLPVLLAEAVVITLVAMKLNTIRDVDQGFIASRRGRAEAKENLLSPLGLTVRLLRKTVILWIVVMLVLAASYGSVVGRIHEFVGDSPEYLEVIGIPRPVVESMSDDTKASIIAEYFGVFVTSMMALICAVPILVAAIRARSEERDGLTEHILSKPVTRTRYLSGFVLISFATSVVIQFVSAIGLYSSTASNVGGLSFFTAGSLLKANLVYLPALWVMIGVAVLIIGFAPRATGIIWAYFAFTFFMMFFGNMPGLVPDFIQKLSPFSHIPRFPLDDVRFGPLAVLTVIAAALTAAGFLFYRRRDSAQ